MLCGELWSATSLSLGTTGMVGRGQREAEDLGVQQRRRGRRHWLDEVENARNGWSGKRAVIRYAHARHAGWRIAVPPAAGCRRLAAVQLCLAVVFWVAAGASAASGAGVDGVLVRLASPRRASPTCRARLPSLQRAFPAYREAVRTTSP